ncbi:hypothetical protein FOA52_010411 [Chlamydomonas sp. UWO 241]|nr:hypothetical protein FOA52_010411 [Chlamydomonas sp. UWO 241]
MTINLMVAALCFAIVVLTTIVQYINIGYTRAMLQRAHPDQRNASWRRCYLCTSIVISMLLIIMIAGLVTSILGFYVIILIKVPDFGLTMVDVLGTAATKDLGAASENYEIVFVIFAGAMAPLGVVLVLCGLGSVLVYRRMIDNTWYSEGGEDQLKLDVAAVGDLKQVEFAQDPEGHRIFKSTKVHPSSAVDNGSRRSARGGIPN